MRPGRTENDRRRVPSLIWLLQRGNAIVFFCEHSLNRVFSNRNVHPGPQKAKSVARAVDVSGIERQPTVTRPDNVPKVSVVVGESANCGRIAPLCRICLRDSPSRDSFHDERTAGVKPSHDESLTDSRFDCISTRLNIVFY
jgi:hypothetical protein